MMLFTFPIRRSAAALAGALALAAAVTVPAEPAADTPELVKAVLERGPEAARARCAYTRTSVDDDGSKSERYDPWGQGPSWTLLSIDGRSPTQEELAHYAGKAEKRADRRHPLAFDLREMVSEDRWELREESEDEATYQFRLRPNEDLDERLVDKVLGTLVVNKERLEPVRITIENTEPAYVAPFVRIASYTQTMRFDHDDNIDGAVLVETETHRRGRALGLKSLRKDKTVHYKDYTCTPGLPMSAGGS